MQRLKDFMFSLFLELDRTTKAKMLRKLRPAAAPVIAENDDEENIIIEDPIAME